MRRVGSLTLIAIVLPTLAAACAGRGAEPPSCGRQGDQWIVVAQSVPTATQLPCIRSLPAGWIATGSRVERGSYTAWFDSDRAGAHALEIELTSSCDVSHAVEIPDTVLGARTFDEAISTSPAYAADRFVTFAGGCITYSFRFSNGAAASLAGEILRATGVRPRDDVRRALRRIGLTLCGAGAPPCPG